MMNHRYKRCPFKIHFPEYPNGKMIAGIVLYCADIFSTEANGKDALVDVEDGSLPGNVVTADMKVKKEECSLIYMTFMTYIIIRLIQ